MRCPTSLQRPLLDHKAYCEVDVRLHDAFEKWSNGNPLLQLRPRSASGIFRAHQLCPTVFMSFGHRHECTTRNIPELGIRPDIPLTEYRAVVASTRKLRGARTKNGLCEPLVISGPSPGFL